jgi:hypothetical protein
MTEREYVEVSAQIAMPDLDLGHEQLGYLAAELVARVGTIMRDEHRMPVNHGRTPPRLVLRVMTQPDHGIPPW